MTGLEKLFEQTAWDYVKECKKLGYHPTYTIDMMTRMGAVEAARHILDHSADASGFVRLFELDRLELSVEALALQEQFRGLFTVTQRNEAHRRLRQMNYPVSPDKDETAS